jgi:hypothetical protein
MDPKKLELRLRTNNYQPKKKGFDDPMPGVQALGRRNPQDWSRVKVGPAPPRHQPDTMG